jgi:peptidoglycan/LPS O-acetylase OafA/YrhL
MKSSNIRYLPEVDHLRALAAVLIVFYHGFLLLRSKIAFNTSFNESQWIRTKNPLLAFITEGHTAVALFMVLSGFIFMYGAYKRPFSASKFLLNRVLRIYPLFIFTIIVGVVVYPGNFSISGLAQSLLLLANLPGALDLHQFTNVSWTISVEFQFYLLFPFLLLFMERRGVRFAFQLIALALIFRIIVVVAGGRPDTISYSYINGRIDQFLLGMVAAVALRDRWIAQRLCRIIAVPSIVLVLLVMLSFHLLGGYPLMADWKVLWPTIEGGMWAIVVASYVGASFKLPTTISRVICSIGEKSFSIYLLHLVVISTVVDRYIFIRVGSPTQSAIVSTALIVLPATLALSYLTYHTIEAPFLSIRRKYISDSSKTDAAPQRAEAEMKT